MANILINGLKSKAGGGKNILRNYILQLYEAKCDHVYYILTPEKNEYIRYSKKNLIFVDVNYFLKKNLFFAFLYFFEFPILLNKLKIDLIFNFGDIIIPTHKAQVYFFDWANAVYKDDFIWKKMGLKSFIINKVKVFLIKKFIGNVDLIIAQTQNIENRLKFYYNIEKIIVIPTPVSLDFKNATSKYDFKLPKDKKKFLFPASFASHKNFEILIPLAKLISLNNLPFTIILTIEGKDAKRFIRKTQSNSYNCIINLGKISGSLMPDLYKQCDVVLFPTLLESFGLPYYEAFAYGKPMLTSDLDFAHEMCGDLAFYFNPFNAESILKVMVDVCKNDYIRNDKVIAAKAMASDLPSWKEVFNHFQNQVEIILNKELYDKK